MLICKSPLITEQSFDEADVAVMFHRADASEKEAVVLSVMEAAALGYYVSLQTSRLALRSFYSSLLSFSVKVVYEDRDISVFFVFVLLLFKARSPESVCIFYVACKSSEFLVMF